MKLNLYKIDSDFNEEINSKLEEKDYILCGSVSVESIKYDLFVNQNNRENIFWLNSMKQVFGTLNDMDDFGTIYNGILLISFSKIRKYAVTFGYAFHVLQEICDLNFALDFAEKQLQSSHINLKSSSYVQNVKIKGLINLRSDLIAMNEAGESFNFVSGTPLNTDHFGKKLECSNSIQCSKKFSLQNLEDLKKIGHHINQIDLVISKSTTINPFPRVRYLPKKLDLNCKLDCQLICQLINDEHCLDINLSAFEIMGNNIILYGNEFKYCIYIKHHKNDSALHIETITTNVLIEYLRENKNEISSLENVIIQFIKEDDTKFLKNIKQIIFAEVEYDNKKYILDDGCWGECNQKFMNELSNQLDYINDNHTIYDEYNFYVSYENEDGYIKEVVKNNNDLLKMHRVLVRVDNVDIEVADLFNKNRKELLAVKLGKDNKDLIYSFDQAMNSIQCIRNHRDYKLEDKLLNKGFTHDDVDAILSSNRNSVLIGLEQTTYRTSIRNSTFSLNDLKSLLLRLKIVSWAKYANDANIEFKLYIIPGEKICKEKIESA